VEFIHACLKELDQELRQRDSRLIVLHDFSTKAIPELVAKLGIEAVFANHDYEPSAIERDNQVNRLLNGVGCRFLTFKDQVIFEKDEVLSLSKKPFSVFTPYKKAWLKKLQSEPYDPASHSQLAPYPLDIHAGRFAKVAKGTLPLLPALATLGFEKTDLDLPKFPAGMSGATLLLEDFSSRIGRYDKDREFPAIQGSSRLSVHLRFGTISIRTLVRHAMEAILSGEANSGAATWLSELIWREFYSMILYHRPDIVAQSFKPEYDSIAWESGPEAEKTFQAWCDGRTGYPLVDAAMHQLNQTGYMHNRLRMVTACFLIKDLGIDWRWGERYFAQRLLDYDLASNNGGWQWAASSGCDAQPYFRIFNPVTQSRKFDSEGKFIRQYLPSLRHLDNRQIHSPWLASEGQLKAAGVLLGQTYPGPIVPHDEARRRTLQRYSIVKKPVNPHP
jgi:deoxyribodipyrimidine photo-lyase